MSAAPLHLAGAALLLDPAGALYWPAQSLLAIADLHLEKGSAFAARGQLLPPYDSAATLERLAALFRRYRPATIIALGDSFHDNGAPARLASGMLARLDRLTRLARVVWVRGNHDPDPPDGLGGKAAAEFRLAPFIFRHQAGDIPADGAEICGHFHPKARVPARGTSITRPCFVAGAGRLLLPAFGAYAGGLDITDPAIGALFPRGGRAFLLGRERLYSFPLTRGRRTASSSPSPSGTAHWRPAASRP